MGDVLHEDGKLRLIAHMAASAGTPVDSPELFGDLVAALGVNTTLDALDSGIGWPRLALAASARTAREERLDVSAAARAVLTEIALTRGTAPRARHNNAAVDELVGHGALVPVVGPVVNCGAGRDNRWVAIPLSGLSTVLALTDGTAVEVRERSGPDGLDPWPLDFYLRQHRAEFARLEAMAEAGEDRGCLGEEEIEEAAGTMLALTPAAQARGDDTALLALASRFPPLAGGDEPLAQLHGVLALLRMGQGDARLARAMLDRGHDDPRLLPVGRCGQGELLTGANLAIEAQSPRLAANATLDAALRCAHSDELDDAARLVAVAFGSALNLDDDFTARCCLAEALIAARLGASDEECTSYLATAWSLLLPHGVRPFVRALATTLAHPAIHGRPGLARATLAAARHVLAGLDGQAIEAVWALRPFLRDIGLAELPVRDDGASLGARELLLANWGPGGRGPPAPEGRRHHDAAPGWAAAAAALTRRETEVATHLTAGLTNEQIARRLGISRWTVVNHVRNLMRKLEVGSRVEVATLMAASGVGLGARREMPRVKQRVSNSTTSSP